jgi:hypothetical protein
VPPAHLAAEIDALRLGMAGDAEALHARLAATGFFDRSDPQIAPDAVLDHFRDVTGWYLVDRELTIDRELVARVLIEFGDPRSRHWDLVRRETVPPDALLARRMEALTLGVLGQLRATANWHRIAREWLFGEPPATPLGEEEAAFRGHGRTAAERERPAA